MLLLGIDIGTSSIKVSVVDAASRQCLATATYPETESAIQSPQPGWAEQSPDMWWEHVQQAIRKANALGLYNPKDIKAIGIAYQMHGLVMVDQQKKLLRPSIIWCDSRAVPIGEKAFKKIGKKKALTHLLNSPGNFTASKLAWVKENEPGLFNKTDKIMLPGDYIALQFTGTLTTSIAALSEGIFWDFKKNRLSEDVFDFFGFDKNLIPAIQPVFSDHGQLLPAIAGQLSLTPGIPVSYKAGDQPNNALSLNVMEPGEVAATAGTSGVIYGVSDQLTYDRKSRINSFAHVNHRDDNIRTGVLLCINGTGILNSWVRNQIANHEDYMVINDAAASVPAGSNGLRILPFGNGAERMLNNKTVGAQIGNLNLNLHTRAHVYRAVQEGIACAFRFGLDIMRENAMNPRVIRAGNSNMFLSPVFKEAFVNITGVPVELHAHDGSMGAALGAGIGSGIFKDAGEAFDKAHVLATIEPCQQEKYEPVFQAWKKWLDKFI
ncbi:MAG: carbohydrate kinase [Terrimonas sp.]|nr:carbohydrate kinase [Terrimonas sp.]